MDEIFESMGPEETAEFAEKLGREARSGGVYCLSGDLGVGQRYLQRALQKDLAFRKW